MPQGPHQILMQYAPRRPRPPQARNRILATLRAAARAAAPGAAWPGCVPWRPGSPGSRGPAPRPAPGHLTRKRKQRHPKPALTPGSPRRRRPPNPPHLHQAVIRGRPERCPPRQASCPARNPVQGQPARRWAAPCRPHRAEIRGRPERCPPREPSCPARTQVQSQPAPHSPQDLRRPARHPAPDQSARCQARQPWRPAQNGSRGWPGHREPWTYCQARSGSPGPRRRNRPLPGAGRGPPGSRPACAGPTACAGRAAWPGPIA
jgi:hypothetical protein